jgi:hypothetical protein
MKNRTIESTEKKTETLDPWFCGERGNAGMTVEAERLVTRYSANDADEELVSVTVLTNPEGLTPDEQREAIYNHFLKWSIEISTL